MTIRAPGRSKAEHTTSIALYLSANRLEGQHGTELVSMAVVGADVDATGSMDIGPGYDGTVELAMPADGTLTGTS